MCDRVADGGTFNDEKEGLKAAFAQGTIAMANSGKNCEQSPHISTNLHRFES